jgi:hypothetical protein
MDTSARLEEGKFFLETYWFMIAENVVEKAIEVYGLEGPEAAALRKVFLRPNLYNVELE